jgi:hypothetical protein
MAGVDHHGIDDLLFFAVGGFSYERGDADATSG